MTVAPDSLWERFAAGPPGDAPVLGELGHDQAMAAVDEVAGQLVDVGVRDGESVGLLGANDAHWVVRLLALIRLGARPLLLPADAPPPEVDRLLRAAGAGRHLDGDGAPRGAPAGPVGPPGVLLLATSGSTGAPKIVARTQRSLFDEGRRYARAGLVRPDDRVLLPLPLSHAYALGWLAGAVLVGAPVLPASPNALNTVQRHVEQGATVLVSVPGLARVLVRRRSFADAPKPALRLVMCGAGFVDRELDSQWSERTGIGVSRNYGSSETGAVLWAPPGGPAGCVGRPMPGVDVRLTAADGSTLTGPGQGEVTVVLEDGRVHRMGDLAECDDAGDVTILGRARTGVVRRGARWVSTLEVESVLRSAPGVADVAVVATGTPDSDDQGLTAHYVPAGRTPEALAGLVDFARASLAAHKVPEAFRPCYRLRRTGVGKLSAAPVYRPAGRYTGANRAVLAAALGGLGLWPALTHGATAAQLAGPAGAEEGVLAELLRVAHAHGVLGTDPAPPVDGAGADAWCATDDPSVAAVAQRIVDTVRRTTLLATPSTPVTGCRPPWCPSTGPHDDIRATLGRYRGRVSGGVLWLSADGRGALGGPGVLESLGLGGTDEYPPTALDSWAGSTEPVGAQVGVCVVSGAVHGPAADLSRLAAALRPGGLLLVEDVFVDGSDAAACVGWLASGALSWWSRGELRAGLESVGCTVGTSLRTGPGADATWLVVAERPS